MTDKKPPPLLGYNTNVRHSGSLFHIQTEDSGVEHPHIITHLFVEGTILATKKSSYADKLQEKGWDEKVRQMMKDQHRAMFIELRDGVHDGVAEKIFGASAKNDAQTSEEPQAQAQAQAEPPPLEDSPTVEVDKDGGVRVIRPAVVTEKQNRTAEKKTRPAASYRGRSIFDTPSDNGEFGENLITDKSLDEVILSYLTDELEE